MKWRRSVGGQRYEGSVVTKALVPKTKAKTEAPGFEAKTEAEAVDPETKAKAARQLIGIGYSIPINIKYR